jgi:hypothetical protein
VCKAGRLGLGLELALGQERKVFKSPKPRPVTRRTRGNLSVKIVYKMLRMESTRNKGNPS